MSAGLVPPGGSEVESVSGLSPSFGLYLHHSNLCLCHHRTFFHVCSLRVSISNLSLFFLMTTPVIGLGLILIQDGLILT